MAEGCAGLEVRREKLRELTTLDEPPTPDDFRARQLRARDLLRGDLDDSELAEHAERSVLTTTFDKLLGWAASNSMFPLTFGLACCAIEMIAAVGSPRNDQARFGAEALRASPRQADFIILSGRVSIKMAPVVRRLYDQMLEPRWAISMGACSSSGGMFSNYAVVQGADKFMPIDIHIPGCPPRPEALFYGFNKLQRAIQGHPDQGWRRRYNAIGTEEWARDDVIAGQPSEASEAAYARARQAVATSAESTGPEGPGGPTQRGAGTH
jgi:NADH-quinone oxidoreductase subunit B